MPQKFDISRRCKASCIYDSMYCTTIN